MPPHRKRIFGLILAMTLGADAVAAIFVRPGLASGGLPYLGNFWSGFVLGQAIVAAVWVVLRPRLDLWTWLLPPAVLVAASALRQQIGMFYGWSLLDYGCRTALQMLLTIIAVWLLVRTPWWRRRAPVESQVKLEFSLRQLLAWMTVVALMSAVLARATWIDRQPLALTLTIGVFAPAMIAVGALALATSRLHWLWRFIGYLIVGAAVGLLLAKLQRWTITNQLLVEFISQSLTIAAWIEWGGILPRTVNAVASRDAEGSG